MDLVGKISKFGDVSKKLGFRNLVSDYNRIIIANGFEKMPSNFSDEQNGLIFIK